MVAYVFDRILQQGATEAPARAEAARQWYRQTAQRTAVNPQSLIRSDRERFRRVPSIGQMYMFQYDPKYKDVLPYYDRFPLVIPFEQTRRVGRAQGDGFYGLNVLNCNATGCDERNNYGPIWEYLSLEMNVETVSIVLATFMIILMLTIYIKLFDILHLDKFILQFLFISPPIVFGLERGQFDFHFVLISLYALRVFKKNKFISYLLICFAIQVKLYPIFLFAGMIFYFYKMKETKNLIESSVILLINSIVLIFYYFRVNFSERIQDQSGISQTYGIQSHAQNYSDFLNVDLLIGYFGQLIIILFFIGYFLKVRQNKSLNEPGFVYLSFSSLFILSSLIGNIDFRLIIFCIPLIFLLEKGINFVSISGLYLIASSPSMYFNGFQNVNQNIVFTIIETIPVLISHLSFLIMFSYFIYEFIFYFFKNDMFANK